LAGLTLVSSPGIQITVQISIDGGGKVPVLIGNYFPILRLKQTSGSVIEQRLSAPSLRLPIPSAVNTANIE
jgi:hypothetical protein